MGVKPHPVRFPEKLPSFFIEFLTGPGDTVLDIFARPNTTGSAAEKPDRRWLAFQKDSTYLAASAFRSVDDLPAGELAFLWSQLHSDAPPVKVNRQQKNLVLTERTAIYAPNRKGKSLQGPCRTVAGGWLWKTIILSAQIPTPASCGGANGT